jgi:hypothetical protein
LLLSSFADLRKLAGLRPERQAPKIKTKKPATLKADQSFPAGDTKFETVQAEPSLPVKLAITPALEKKEESAIHIGA